MSTLTIAEYLKYANLQMAAEALYTLDATQPNIVLTPGEVRNGPITIENLTIGNRHASKFTAIQAAEFAQQWEVVEHKSNTTTGFSGTLFRNKANPNELVMSFRSTEFIDDAVRDNQVTHTGEIRNTGYAPEWKEAA